LKPSDPDRWTFATSVRLAIMLRKALQCVLLTAVVLAVSVSAGVTDSPASSTKLSVQGLEVSWFGSATLKAEPGSALTVRIRRTGGAGRSTVANLGLLRVSRSGRVLGVVKRSALRSGTFRVKVPSGSARRYRLDLRVGSTLKRLWVETPAVAMVHTPEPAVAPAPAPPAPPAPGMAPNCLPGGAMPGAAIQLQASSVAAGQPIVAGVTNTGGACLSSVAWPYTFERAIASGWEAIPRTLPMTDQIRTMSAGEIWAPVPLTPPIPLTAGHYRLLATFWSDQGLVVASAEFDVV
jgi:hypothetical protein